jgi:hypothetical protein
MPSILIVYVLFLYLTLKVSQSIIELTICVQDDKICPVDGLATISLVSIFSGIISHVDSVCCGFIVSVLFISQ